MLSIEENNKFKILIPLTITVDKGRLSSCYRTLEFELIRKGYDE